MLLSTILAFQFLNSLQQLPYLIGCGDADQQLTGILGNLLGQELFEAKTHHAGHVHDVLLQEAGNLLVFVIVGLKQII